LRGANYLWQTHAGQGAVVVVATTVVVGGGAIVVGGAAVVGGLDGPPPPPPPDDFVPVPPFGVAGPAAAACTFAAVVDAVLGATVVAGPFLFPGAAVVGAATAAVVGASAVRLGRLGFRVMNTVNSIRRRKKLGPAMAMNRRRLAFGSARRATGTAVPPEADVGAASPP